MYSPRPVGKPRPDSAGRPRGYSGADPSAAGGQDDPTDDPLPVLPPLTDRLYVVHYTTARPYDRRTAIPPVLAVVLRNLLTGEERVYETFTAAECDRLPPGDLDAHFPRYERDTLFVGVLRLRDRRPGGRLGVLAGA